MHWRTGFLEVCLGASRDIPAPVDLVYGLAPSHPSVGRTRIDENLRWAGAARVNDFWPLPSHSGWEPSTGAHPGRGSREANQRGLKGQIEAHLPPRRFLAAPWKSR
jgi:hypothetical protein